MEKINVKSFSKFVNEEAKRNVLNEGKYSKFLLGATIDIPKFEDILEHLEKSFETWMRNQENKSEHGGSGSEYTDSEFSDDEDRDESVSIPEAKQQILMTILNVLNENTKRNREYQLDIKW